uniref:Uncharacterized protein n=1 Tax=Saccharomyces cerevisiae TaxID=4932 RepID=E9P9Z9_YEASX|nr:unknown [Saccharomyces cerevisiae]
MAIQIAFSLGLHPLLSSPCKIELLPIHLKVRSVATPQRCFEMHTYCISSPGVDFKIGSIFKSLMSIFILLMLGQLIGLEGEFDFISEKSSFIFLSNFILLVALSINTNSFEFEPECSAGRLVNCVKRYRLT